LKGEKKSTRKKEKRNVIYRLGFLHNRGGEKKRWLLDLTNSGLERAGETAGENQKRGRLLRERG